MVAVKNHFTNDTPLKDATGGRFYFGHAPQNVEGKVTTVLPFIVLIIVWNNTDKTFTEDIEEFLLQFNIFAKSYNECDNIFKKLRGDQSGAPYGYDFAEMQVEGYKPEKMIRMNTTLTAIPEEACWRCQVQYRIDLEKVGLSERI